MLASFRDYLGTILEALNETLRKKNEMLFRQQSYSLFNKRAITESALGPEVK